MTGRRSADPTPQASPPSDGVATADWVPAREAARRLGLSTSTLERRIKAGGIRAEKYSRPQGSYLLVYVPLRDSPPEAPDDDPPTPQEAPATPRGVSGGMTLDLTPLVQLVRETQAQLLEAVKERALVEACLEVETSRLEAARAQLGLAEARVAELEAALAVAGRREAELEAAVVGSGGGIAGGGGRSWWEWWLPGWPWRTHWTG